MSLNLIFVAHALPTRSMRLRSFLESSNELGAKIIPAKKSNWSPKWSRFPIYQKLVTCILKLWTIVQICLRLDLHNQYGYNSKKVLLMGKVAKNSEWNQWSSWYWSFLYWIKSTVIIFVYAAKCCSLVLMIPMGYKIVISRSSLYKTLTCSSWAKSCIKAFSRGSTPYFFRCLVVTRPSNWMAFLCDLFSGRMFPRV